MAETIKVFVKRVAVIEILKHCQHIYNYVIVNSADQYCL